MLVVCNGMIRSGSTLQYNLVKSLVERTNTGIGKGFIFPDQFEDLQDQLIAWAEDRKIYVIKSHTLLPNIIRLCQERKILIIYSYRDIRDVSLSVQRKFNRHGDYLIKMLDEAIETYNHIHTNFKSYVLSQKYEDLISDLSQGVREISQKLKIEVSQKLVNEIAEEWAIENIKKRARFFEYEVEIKNKLRKLLTALGMATLTKRVLRFSKIPHHVWRGSHDKNNLLHKGHLSESAGETELWRTQMPLKEQQKLTQRYKKWLLHTGYSIEL